VGSWGQPLVEVSKKCRTTYRHPAGFAADSLVERAADQPGLPAPTYYTGGEPPRGPDWRRIFASVVRYKWLVLGVVVLGTAAGFGASRLIKPSYLARATIWVDVVDPRSRGAGSFTLGGQLPVSTVGTDLLESDAVMDWVVREHRLYLGWDAEEDSAAFAQFDLRERFRIGKYTLQVDDAGQNYSLVGEDGQPIETGAVGDSVGRSLGWVWIARPRCRRATRSRSS
jgi:hypothetical protein